MTNLIIMRGVRFGFAERPQIWFWRAFPLGNANDNARQTRDLFGPRDARRERKSPSFFDDELPAGIA
jgi:hypothetical protein